MARVEFVGRSRQDADNVAASPARLVNCYREPAGESRFSLKSVLGTTLFSDLASPVGRVLRSVNQRLYAAAGGFLHEISLSSGSASILGSINDDPDTIIEGYEQNVTLAAGGVYYVWNGATLLPIGGGAFDDVGSVAFLSGYTILTEEGGSLWEWTDLQDPSTRDPLNVATAEAFDDNLLRAVALGGNLYLMGTRSIEIWALTGAAGADAFERLGGGVIDRGLKRKGLVTVFGEGAFMVGNDGVAYILSGAALQPVSTPSVETAINQGDPTHVFYFEDEGHKHCVIRFSDRPAWVFDLATGEWHERAEGLGLDAWGIFSMCQCPTGRAFGIDATGRVRRFLRSNQDMGETLVRQATSMVFDMQGPRFRVSFLEALCRAGFSNIGRDAEVVLETSQDGGVTWGPPKSRSVGDTGGYRARATWRALGQFRSFTVRFTIADAAEIPLYADMRMDVA